MTNNINLNSVSGAIIPYTPPKSAEEFVNGEVVKKAHEIFEKAINFNLNHSIEFQLSDCKLLKVPQELFLKWKHLANRGLLPNEDFLSILRDEEVLPNLFYFLDSNSLQNLSQFSSLKEDVDQYSEQIFEYYFGKPSNAITLDDLKFENFENRLLNKAIENHAPGIAIEKFFSTLFQNKQIDNDELDEILYIAIHRAIGCHVPADTILSLLRVGEIKKIDDLMEGPVDLLELTLKEKIATKELIEGLLRAGCELNCGFFDCTICNAVKYGASDEVINLLLQVVAKTVQENNESYDITINDAIDCHASAEVIQSLLNAGVKGDDELDKFQSYPQREYCIFRALTHGASFEIIKTLLNGGAIVNDGIIDFSREIGASREVVQLLEESLYKRKIELLEESQAERERSIKRLENLTLESNL